MLPISSLLQYRTSSYRICEKIYGSILHRIAFYTFHDPSLTVVKFKIKSYTCPDRNPPILQGTDNRDDI